MNHLAYWIALGEIAISCPDQYQSLFPEFDSIEAIFDAGVKELSLRTNLKPKAIKTIAGFKDFEKIAKIQRALEKLGDVEILTLVDSDYPSHLLNIFDPPPVLYIRGNRSNFRAKAVSIVGSRKATRYGLSITTRIASELARAGVTIVSGLALGIDGAAHKAALDEKGNTVAVLGCGIDVVYPLKHRDLFARISSAGTIITEYSPGSPPLAWHFPKRNRLISGLSLGTLVVEASEGSGSIITARLALDQGKDVFAVPGHIDSTQSKGPHKLIQQGAKLVASSTDIIEEFDCFEMEQNDLFNNLLDTTVDPVETTTLSEEAKKVLGQLDREPRDFDDIVLSTELASQEVLRCLSQLMMDGIVECCGSQRYIVATKN